MFLCMGCALPRTPPPTLPVGNGRSWLPTPVTDTTDDDGDCDGSANAGSAPSYERRAGEDDAETPAL